MANEWDFETLENNTEISLGNEEPASKWSTLAGLGRAVGQGITFGLADEIEAKVRAALDPDASYEEVHAKVSEEIDNFQKAHPRMAIGAEIAGAIATGITGGGLALAGGRAAAKAASRVVAPRVAQIGQAVTQGGGIPGAAGRWAGIGATEGGIYGAGAARPGERIEGLKGGAMLGGALGPVARAAGPIATRAGKELSKRGVRLSPGEAFTGGLGLAQRATEGAARWSFLAPSVLKAKSGNRLTMNRAANDEALAPMKQLDDTFVTPRNLKNGQDLNLHNKNLIDKKYSEILEELNPSEEAINKLGKELDGFTVNLENLAKREKGDSKSASDLLRFITEHTLPSGSANAIRNYTKRLRNASYTAQREGNEKLSEGLQELHNILTKALSEGNEKAFASLNALDEVFRNTQIIAGAVKKAGFDADGIFTPKQLDQAISQNKFTRQLHAVGNAPMQGFARLAKEGMSDEPARAAGSEFLGRLSAVAPALPAVMTAGSRLGQGATRGVFHGLEKVARHAPRVASGNEDANNFSQYILTKILRGE